MVSSRRKFLRVSGSAAGALLLGAPGAGGQRSTPSGRASRPLRLLILGGTGFIGPHQVRYALARGHQITLFNRGRTNPGLFPDVERLTGDRDNDLEALKGREWDAVIDNSARVPRWVRQSASLLRDAADQYLFISTMSVFQGYPEHGMDETAPLKTIDDPTIEEVNGRTYGPLKVLCEREAEKAFPGRATIVRPCLIVGPGDRTDRWTYWPVRIAEGGEVLAPGIPDTLVRYIDARDLTEWCIRLLEEKRTGVFNAVGPRSHLSIAEMLYGIRAITAAPISFTWVDVDFLAEQQVRGWSDLPAWQAPRPDNVGYGSVSRDRAIAAGLSYRPLAVTANDTLDWWRTLAEERRRAPRTGLSRSREAEVLAAWQGMASQTLY